MVSVSAEESLSRAQASRLQGLPLLEPLLAEQPQAFWAALV